jgi:hypothetical protein
MYGWIDEVGLPGAGVAGDGAAEDENQPIMGTMRVETGVEWW